MSSSGSGTAPSNGPAAWIREWEHRLYAERDLTVLEAQHAR
jgi:hypothetical protein